MSHQNVYFRKWRTGCLLDQFDVGSRTAHINSGLVGLFPDGPFSKV